MAIKNSYKIPATLDRSILDSELNLKSDNGLGVKPVPLRVILLYGASLLVAFWVISNSFIASGTLGQKIMFGILWAALTVVLAKTDKTKRMQAQLIPALLEYLPKASRYVVTRRSANASPFYRICGIDKIEDDSGLVSYIDGSYGFFYRVVGSASVLLFEDDRDAIIDRVDLFYRKLGIDCELIFITTKEAQRIVRQALALQARQEKLEPHLQLDPDFIALIDDQKRILRDHVGKNFKSIHQFLVIKADNREALMANKNVLQSEVENSSRMIKQCVPLYEQDIAKILKSIYGLGV